MDRPRDSVLISKPRIRSERRNDRRRDSRYFFFYRNLPLAIFGLTTEPMERGAVAFIYMEHRQVRFTATDSANVEKQSGLKTKGEKGRRALQRKALSARGSHCARVSWNFSLSRS